MTRQERREVELALLERLSDELWRISDRYEDNEDVLYALQMVSCWVQEETIPTVDAVWCEKKKNMVYVD